MTESQADEFISKVIRSLWPNWSIPDGQYDLWVRLLCRYDYERSKQKLESWYQGTERPGREPVMGIIKKFLVPEGGREKRDPTLLFALRPADGGWETKFFISGDMPDVESIEREAERCRRQAENSYGRDYVIIRYWETPEPSVDDGLRGPEALEMAKAEILAGPDTPGKRFLMALEKPNGGPKF